MGARLTYANVMSTIAVVLALGGTSYAAITITGKNVRNGSLTGADVRRDSLTGRQIREAALGKVPRASRADGAARSDSAAAADTAATASTAATLAGRGPDAFQAAGAPAGGALAGSYPNPTLAPPAVRFLGYGGPPLQNGWEYTNSPGVWKDGAGVVHLQGTVSRSAPGSGVIFTLPAGLRPPNIGSRFFAVPVASGLDRLEVSGTGAVSVLSPTTLVAFDGVSFIAGG
jgi:hypothetical protein